MKYVIPAFLLILSLVLSSVATYCSYLTITDSWTWLFVAIGIGYSATAGWLATSAAFDAVKHW